MWAGYPQKELRIVGFQAEKLNEPGSREQLGDRNSAQGDGRTDPEFPVLRHN